jgi:hypothetical protein
MGNLNPRWCSHLKGKDAKKFDEQVRHGKDLLERLTTVINQKITSLECPTLDDYNNNSWAYKQADRVGQLRAYRDLLKLTDLT